MSKNQNVRYLTEAELVTINKYAVEMVGGKTFGVQSYEALQVIVEQPAQVIFGREFTQQFG